MNGIVAIQDNTATMLEFDSEAVPSFSQTLPPGNDSGIEPYKTPSLVEGLKKVLILGIVIY